MYNFPNGRIRCFACVLAALFILPAVSRAQTGPELLIKPWQRDQIIEASTEATFYNKTNTDNPSADGKSRNADFTLSEYASTGRVRLFPRNAEVRADPRFGYDVSYFDLNTADARLPKKLTNEAVAVGMGIADWNGWLAGLTVGIGYAGAGAFQDGNGYYGKADLLIGHDLNKDTQLGIVLDYDGNRSFLPDVPLPGLELTKTIDPTLLLALGFPLCSVTWTPDKSRTLDRQLTIEGTYTIPDNFEGRADYALIDAAAPVGKIGAFIDYTDRTLPFHDNDLNAPGRYRLFFLQRRAEFGANWSPRPLINVIAAGGVAFDQEFREGWDSKNYRRLAKPGDELYVRVGLEFRY